MSIKEYWVGVREGKITREKPNKKLTSAQIAVALKMYNEGYTYEVIAEKFGVSITTIRFTIGEKLKTFSLPKWTEAAYALRTKGLSFAEIGKELGMSRQRIHQVLSMRKEDE